MQQAEVAVAALQPVDRRVTTVRGAVVDDPEDAPRRGIGRHRHHLIHQAAEGCDAGLGFAAREQLGPVHIPGGEVLKRAATFVLMLNPHGATRRRCQRGVTTAPRLDRRLLVSGDDELIGRQAAAMELAGVEVEDGTGFGLEGGVAREIQLRVVQGRSASSASQRQMVAPEISATNPRRSTSLRISGTCNREMGRPSSVGN